MHVLLIVVLAAVAVGQITDENSGLVPMTFKDAMKICESQNLYIGTPDIKGNNVNFMIIMRMRQVKRMWIGVHRMNDTSAVPPYSWTTHKGAALSAEDQYWGPKEPNNLKNLERCVEMRDLKKNSRFANWNDVPCNIKKAFFCL